MTPHPLDPLSADEIRQAAAILRRDRDVTDRWRFASIELKEPPKQGGAEDRRATVICWNRDDGHVFKSLVNVSQDAVETWDHVPDGQPNMTVDEFEECNEILRRDPRVIEALARRGITDMEHVLIDTWAYGAHLVPEQHRGGRVGWADLWYRKEPFASPYANPVTGLHLVIDLNRMELLEIEDTHHVEEPETMGEYVPRLVPGQRLRDDIKALHIHQPDGPSFTLDGNAVEWQKWSLRVGFNPREGMVLHTVAYDGRSVAHRLSFAEMVVPYRDPTTDHYRRTAFDIGEWGLGFMTDSLELGCDCLGEIRYLDATVHDTRGEPQTIVNAICIHEEDDGVLWKHVDAEAGAET
ncbi:MAG TPA: tyramine oxidase, partial [Solirubrobacteraceae bacterium]|nr:tyramine oxidase [Solirubrobacteraceae bacterium]